MRSRRAILAAALLLTVITTVPALAAAPRHVLAQADQSDSETQGESEDGAGQSDAEAETGAEEGATGSAEPETGPPWTFQMAWIAIALTILLALAIFRWYWKLVGSRSKGTA